MDDRNDKNERKDRIIIAEDDRDILNLLALYLKSDGYEVLTAENGKEALELIREEKPDLGIFDIMMPVMDGYELLAETRKFTNIPVIFLTAKDSDQEKILGLDLGADDYIPKPFNPLEVTARVRSALRRYHDLNPKQNAPASGEDASILQAGDLSVNLTTLTVRKGEAEIPLTATELKLLILFMQHPGWVYTKRQLMEQINENFLESDINAIRVHISNLREKLGTAEDGADYIKTVRGLGYKFNTSETGHDKAGGK